MVAGGRPWLKLFDDLDTVELGLGPGGGGGLLEGCTRGLVEGGGGGAQCGLWVVGLGLGDTLGEEFRLEEEELWKGFSMLLGAGGAHLLGAGSFLAPADWRALDTERPVCTPPAVFFRVGMPPANRPPIPGSGPEPESWPPPPPWFCATPRPGAPPPPPEFVFLFEPTMGALLSFVTVFFNFVPP